MRTCGNRIVSANTALALVFGLSLASCLPDAADAQATLKPLIQETLEIGDEPGRISTEEVVITDGPYARQVVFFRSNETPGTRALYLGSTVFRIHGTNQPETIGHAISSGCFRLANGDVIDLYERVPLGTKVVVRQGASL